MRNPKNLGMAQNWNRCLDVAETELVTLLHGDDELCPRYGARMVGAMGAFPRAAAAFCRYEAIGPASERITSLTDRVKDYINPTGKTDTVLEGEPGMRALLRANFIAAPSLCYRKSVLGESPVRRGLEVRARLGADDANPPRRRPARRPARSG